MFKKPLSGTKTSAPLRSSDRRKLKQRVVVSYGISAEDGDLLVPDGLLSMKFSTHLEEPGTAYLSQEGDPLWFALGRSSDELIPTVYTLWKRQNLLPTLSTPAAVIPVLVGGADLMIPGVVHHTASLNEGQLVSVLQYNYSRENPTMSPPLAVGRMALPSDRLQEGGQEKGKAVIILHTWKDHLWDMGSKCDAPESTPLPSKNESIGNGVDQEVPPPKAHAEMDADGSDQVPTQEMSTLNMQPGGSTPSYKPQEISELLHHSLLQAISLGIPANVLPMIAPTFFSTYVLPSRPAFPGSIIPHSGPPPIDASPCPSSGEINIKGSTYKSLIAFLKAEEKLGLVTLKSPPKGDIVVTSVNKKGPAVEAHRKHVTIKDIETTTAKKAAREEKVKENENNSEVDILELYRPHQATIGLFEAMGASTTNSYSLQEVKTLLNSYITLKNLVNPRVQAYINLDEALVTCVSRTSAKSKGKDAPPEPTDHLRRDELLKAVLERMQNWYEVKAPRHDPVRKKGQIAPIQVTMKVRQGRKACTLITGFEPYLVVNAEELAEDLRKSCAGATSVAPIPGKSANSGMEVFVQGKQSKIVAEYLMERGIPKKWIEIRDLSGKK